ncbi:hypothetical protein FZC79_05025 [Rossellomorea vietnamensis]|uniref:Uncharacterized protein n=1 Tax=Rossellomorea vietnamensis TaxID=218284 RepID=A0A5D4KIH9_9BACI|nr:hypothetical protein [Rossellomorea vietnamensis]TYR77061.1 hypothetical protein FZC79_05025 [Rossellomorea vietnamensis]
MKNIKKPIKENRKIDSLLMALVVILLVKNAIDLFFFDLLPTAADNLFWFLISTVLIVTFFIKRNYIYLAIMLVLLIAGLVNLSLEI